MALGRNRNKIAVLKACIAAYLLFVSGADAKKLAKFKPGANPPQYIAFSKLLSEPDRQYHALNRLTFGPRPGDLERLQAIGLDQWLQLELHPERLTENPDLEHRLAPFDSMRLSIHDTVVHYPPPRLIIAVARGRAPLPEDPQLRAIVVRLADRYQRRQQESKALGSANEKAQSDGATVAKELNDDDSDLDLKAKLSDFLTPDQIEILKSGKPDEIRNLLASLPPEKHSDFVWALRPQQRRQLLAFAPVDLRRELMLSVNPQNVVALDLIESKLMRAIYSNHQLEELLVDFWFNHFNVFLNKGADRYLTPTYEREAIRPYVFGRFSDMLLATAKSPAMLFFLDNWQSVGMDSVFELRYVKQKNKRGLNENYGRELLELHTLGVDGGYTQRDVIDVARCFTGWTIANPHKGGDFEYNDRIHDKGSKVVLGHVIPAGGGMNDGLKVLDILAHHPSTAHFISLKLAQRFVADDPPPSLVAKMAAAFLKTDGDLRDVMHTLLNSPEFWSKGAYQAKMKTSLEMVVSAVRATNADVSSAFLLSNELQKLGEPLYRKIEPTGYSNLNAEWISSASLLDRMNFALALTSNRVAGVKVDTAKWQPIVDREPMQLAQLILEQAPSAQTKGAIQKMLQDPEVQRQLSQKNLKAGSPQLPSLVAGLALGSPEFQRH